MNKEQALLLLSIHSGRNPDINDPRWESGFLGVLRPFQGVLTDSNFHEIMECLKALSADFDSKQIGQEVVSDLWGICYTARVWALEKDGMLQRNNLLTEEQIQILDEWLDIIAYAVMNLLWSNSDEAFEGYERYCKEAVNHEWRR